MRTRVKICGITRPEDALAIAAAGADAIGLLFYPPSKRAVDIETAAQILAGLPSFITITAIFVDEQPERVEQVCEALPIDLLQFHGSENASYCNAFHKPYVKALRVSDGENLTAHIESWHTARGVLLDTWMEGSAGGSGERFDWQLIPGELRSSIILAGGLKPDNVAEAVTQISPYGVDVSGGVEDSPGIKSAKKIQNFMQAVHMADARKYSASAGDGWKNE